MVICPLSDKQLQCGVSGAHSALTMLFVLFADHTYTQHLSQTG